MSFNISFSESCNYKKQNSLNSFKEIIKNPNTQFFHTFEKESYISTSENLFEHFKSKKTFVHIGIGGSSLGPETLVLALKKSNVNFIFINNIDSDEIYDQLKNLDFSSTLFHFVSKSGGTAETLAALSIITQMLNQSGIENDNLKDYYVFTTDPLKSELRELAQKLAIKTLEVPSDVGGRFCALTPAGFFPCLFAGINIHQLVTGAKKAQEICLDSSENNLLIKTCDFLFSLQEQKNIDQTVFMPYSSKLKSLSFWFIQLWAESLGKKFDLNKNTAHTGFTPIAAYGATDQHSQMQLFIEGPNNKAFIVLEVEKPAHNYSLKSSLTSNNLDKLSTFSLNDLMKAELHGSLKALKEAERPYIHVTISENNEENLAALILFFESLTALMGHYLNIDPFNQPGVEAGKIYAFQFLNKLK